MVVDYFYLILILLFYFIFCEMLQIRNGSELYISVEIMRAWSNGVLETF